jgi:hypothetical protein
LALRRLPGWLIIVWPEVSTVKVISRFFAILALAALPLTLMGAVNAPQLQVPKGAAIIYNPGNGDFTGFLILIDHNGRAWAADGAGRGFGQLQPALTQMLFTDLAAAGSARLPIRVCASTQPDLAGTSIWVNAPTDPGAARAPSLECGSDARSEKVVADASLIQRALYVHAYRVRLTPDPYMGSGTSYTGSSASANTYARQAQHSASNASNAQYASPGSFGSDTFGNNGYIGQSLGAAGASGGGFSGAGSSAFGISNGGGFASGRGFGDGSSFGNGATFGNGSGLSNSNFRISNDAFNSSFTNSSQIDSNSQFRGGFSSNGFNGNSFGNNGSGITGLSGKLGQ